MQIVNNIDILPKGFTYITDPRMIITINYVSSDNFMGRPAAGYHQPVCILSLEAASALIEAQNKLDTYNKGYRLKIFDAYRPTQAVQDFMKWRQEPINVDIKKIYFPDLEKDQLFETGYIAPVHSTHSRGSTVDLTITLPSSNAIGYEEMDMGTIFDFFDKKSHTHCADISEKAKKNRQFLIALMEEQGFENYHKEWWHFTLKNEPFPETYFNFPVE